MTQIPSDVPASAAQAGFQANEVAKEREARRAGLSHAANRQVRTVDEAGTTVDTEDADVAVFSDAEGTGSQGREREKEETPPDAEKDAAGGDQGITKDVDGQLHVDLEA